MSLPDSRSESTPIAQVRFAAQIPSPDAGPWWRRRPSPQMIAMGTAGALALAILLGLLLSPAMRPGPAAPVEPNRQSAVVTPAALVEQFTFNPAGEPYRQPSEEQVERAHAAVRDAYRRGGVSELAREGLDCFRRLGAAPAYGQMDYCIAFDMFAEAENARLTGAERPSPASWFGSIGARHLNVAQSVMGAQGDADARLLDLRRMATKIAASRGGAPILEAAPSLRAPAPATQPALETPTLPDGQLAIEVVEPTPPPATSIANAVPAPRPPLQRSAPAAPAPQPVVERVSEPAPSPATEPAAAPLVQPAPVEIPPPPQ